MSVFWYQVYQARLWERLLNRKALPRDSTGVFEAKPYKLDIKKCKPEASSTMWALWSAHSLYWCQALHITNKDRYQNNERPRALARLNSPQVFLSVYPLLHSLNWQLWPNYWFFASIQRHPCHSKMQCHVDLMRYLLWDGQCLSDKHATMQLIREVTDNYLFQVWW